MSFLLVGLLEISADLDNDSEDKEKDATEKEKARHCLYCVAERFILYLPALVSCHPSFRPLLEILLFQIIKTNT